KTCDSRAAWLWPDMRERTSGSSRCPSRTASSNRQICLTTRPMAQPSDTLSLQNAPQPKQLAVSSGEVPVLAPLEQRMQSVVPDDRHPAESIPINRDTADGWEWKVCGHQQPSV